RPPQREAEEKRHSAGTQGSEPSLAGIGVMDVSENCRQQQRRGPKTRNLLNRELRISAKSKFFEHRHTQEKDCPERSQFPDVLSMQCNTPIGKRACDAQNEEKRREEAKPNCNDDIEWKKLKRENLALMFRRRPQPHRQVKAGNWSIVGRWLLVVGQNSSVVAALLGQSSWPKKIQLIPILPTTKDQRPTTVSQIAPRHGKTLASPWGLFSIANVLAMRRSPPGFCY